MTIQSVDTILARIKMAQPSSPVAIFKEKKGFNAVFEATTKTKQLINDSPETYIGSFNMYSNIDSISEALIGASTKEIRMDFIASMEANKKPSLFEIAVLKKIGDKHDKNTSS